uniref:SPIN-DOC-like zinc-finger domain-containing protein n=1 Tax=Oncorhynchus mykiss TaxID=8022 RepID=A0A8C7S1B1_ONCMY
GAWAEQRQWDKQCLSFEWEEDYFLTTTNSKCVCLICQSSVALAKKGNAERHFRTVHKKYESDFPSQLAAQQSIFTRPSSKSKAAMSRILAKHSKPFQDGEMVKEAFLEVAESLFEKFQKYIRNRSILKKYIYECVFFSLQFNESEDMIDTSQLYIFITMVFENMTAKEELLNHIVERKNSRGGYFCGNQGLY